jgi:hypothetical protein
MSETVIHLFENQTMSRHSRRTFFTVVKQNTFQACLEVIAKKL